MHLFPKELRDHLDTIDLPEYPEKSIWMCYQICGYIMYKICVLCIKN